MARYCRWTPCSRGPRAAVDAHPRLWDPLPPEPIGIGKFSGEMTAWLVKQGHEVRVVLRSLPNSRMESDVRILGGRYLRRQWEGATVWPLSGVDSTPTNGHEAGFALLERCAEQCPIVLRQIFWKPHYSGGSATLFCSPIALLAARLSGARSWLHVQDFEVALHSRRAAAVAWASQVSLPG